MQRVMNIIAGSPCSSFHLQPFIGLREIAGIYLFCQRGQLKDNSCPQLPFQRQSTEGYLVTPP